MNNLNAIKHLNTVSPEQAQHLFMQCCTSSLWVKQLVLTMPFIDYDNLLQVADDAWRSLSENDYLEAFDGHPKIGNVNSLREKYANTKALASGEQNAVNHASEATLNALAQGNEAYEKKFGFIFIVCATGKSADEMLELLQSRLPNDRDTELANAAEEQRKIFHLRIAKMLESFHE